MKSLPSEYRALVGLAPDVASFVTPLIQLWDRTPSPDVEEELDEPEVNLGGPGLFGQAPIWGAEPGQIVWERLQRGLLAKVKGVWPDEQPILLDGGWLEGSGAFESVLDNCRSFGRRPLPVTGLSRPAAYQGVVARAVASDRGGLVLRLDRSDFDPGRNPLQERIDAALATVPVMAEETDLVLDLRCVAQAVRERDELLAESMVRSLPYRDRWRNLVVAASCMPKDGSGFPLNDIKPFERVEWWIWLELRARAVLLGRVPVFGDYGVIHPDRVETMTEPKALPRIPRICYAVRDRSLMIRGLDLRGEDDASHLGPLFGQLMSGADWSGSAFSEGDAWMERAARGDVGPGNWGTWKWAGQVHHITHLTRQLATMSDL